MKKSSKKNRESDSFDRLKAKNSKKLFRSKKNHHKIILKRYTSNRVEDIEQTDELENFD